MKVTHMHTGLRADDILAGFMVGLALMVILALIDMRQGAEAAHDAPPRAHASQSPAENSGNSLIKPAIEAQQGANTQG